METSQDNEETLKVWILAFSLALIISMFFKNNCAAVAEMTPGRMKNVTNKSQKWHFVIFFFLNIVGLENEILFYDRWFQTADKNLQF